MFKVVSETPVKHKYKLLYLILSNYKNIFVTIIWQAQNLFDIYQNEIIISKVYFDI